MILGKEIVNDVKKLSYTKSESLDKDVYESTALGLKGMWQKYGYAQVLAALSITWSYDKTVTYFSSMQAAVRGGRKAA